MISPARPETGSVPVVELALLTPLFVVFLLLAAGLGRLGQARAEVDGAANRAAREASLARSSENAEADARAAAAEELGRSSVACRSSEVVVDTADFRPGGWVRVEVRCVVSLGDLALVGVPGERSIGASAVAVVDRLRGVR